jgi:hypothetical protein
MLTSHPTHATTSQTPNTDHCLHCNHLGHWAQDCPQRALENQLKDIQQKLKALKTTDQANLTEVHHKIHLTGEDDHHHMEQCHNVELTSFDHDQMAGDDAQILEVFLKEVEECGMWYFDSSATFHLAAESSVFLIFPLRPLLHLCLQMVATLFLSVVMALFT